MIKNPPQNIQRESIKTLIKKHLTENHLKPMGRSAGIEIFSDKRTREGAERMELQNQNNMEKEWDSHIPERDTSGPHYDSTHPPTMQSPQFQSSPIKDEFKTPLQIDKSLEEKAVERALNANIQQIQNQEEALRKSQQLAGSMEMSEEMKPQNPAAAVYVRDEEEFKRMQELDQMQRFADFQEDTFHPTNKMPSQEGEGDSQSVQKPYLEEENQTEMSKQHNFKPVSEGEKIPKNVAPKRQAPQIPKQLETVETPEGIVEEMKLREAEKGIEEAQAVSEEEKSRQRVIASESIMNKARMLHKQRKAEAAAAETIQPQHPQVLQKPHHSETDNNNKMMGMLQQMQNFFEKGFEGLEHKIEGMEKRIGKTARNIHIMRTMKVQDEIKKTGTLRNSLTDSDTMQDTLPFESRYQQPPRSKNEYSRPSTTPPKQAYSLPQSSTHTTREENTRGMKHTHTPQSEAHQQIRRQQHHGLFTPSMQHLPPPPQDSPPQHTLPTHPLTQMWTQTLIHLHNNNYQKAYQTVLNAGIYLFYPFYLLFYGSYYLCLIFIFVLF